MMYHTILCILNHPLLLTLQIRGIHNASEAFLQQTLFSISNHVTWVMHFIQLMKSKRFSSTDLITIYCAAVVATVELQRSFSQTSETRKKSKRNFEECVEFIETLGNKWACSNRVVKKLRRLETAMSSWSCSNLRNEEDDILVDISGIFDMLDFATLFAEIPTSEAIKDSIFGPVMGQDMLKPGLERTGYTRLPGIQPWPKKGLIIVFLRPHQPRYKMQDSEGLQVDHDAGGGTKAPEVMPAYNPSSPAPYYVAIDQHHQQPPQKPRGPFGLSLWVFTVIVVAITAAIVGGGVGGGLGAALSNCQNSDSKCAADNVDSDGSSTTTTPTPSTSTTTSAAFFTPTPASQIQNLTWFCEEPEQSKTIELTNGFKFKAYCGTDGGGVGNAEGGGTLKDWVGIIAYSLEDCLQACTQMNAMNDSQDTGATCKSVTFRPGLSDSYKWHGSNCWLKDGKKKRPFNYDNVWDGIPTVAYGELL
ncbi:hypothetical protein CEP54_011034 [Fusarium duplospermum]|uniref:Apple domain-containing protein n=1 Tax=Fusarium duplospermum TaxID=1325734 RepID=A0A428PGT6_9HYPO|nr:hypothetical protein CEP54_011034 [Fusarium duplospermum]